MRKLGLYCGVVGPVLWLALIVISGALHTDFSHATHFISELAARGSSTATLMRVGGFEFTALLYLCFAAALLATLRRTPVGVALCLLIALDGIGRLGAGIFPCDPGCVRVTDIQDLHKLFATVGFSAGILAALLSGLLFRGIGPLRPLSSLSIGCGLVALGSLVLMSWDGNPFGHAGLLEHLATVVLSIWLFAVALRVVRLSDDRQLRPQPS
jgi:hypothetical membrane protein